MVGFLELRLHYLQYFMSAGQGYFGCSQASAVVSIHVRLADGSCLIVKLNHIHTVADLKTFINSVRLQFEYTQYSLLINFPKKKLTKKSDTEF